MVIHVLRQGGLGNQLFQVATGLAHAKRTGSLLTISKESSSNRSPYNDTFFANFPRTVTPSNCMVYREPQFNYTELPPKKDLILFGYYQSAKYFQDYHKEIQDEFLSRLQTQKNYVKKYKCPVSIHVRRTDYLTLQGYHPCPSLEYYEAAMKLFPGATFIVFSDDPSWCKKQDVFKNCIFLNTGNSDTAVLTDLYNMSQCHHHILANSSFSWWGAYLAKTDNHKVVAPKQWFGSEADVKNWNDIYNFLVTDTM